MKVDGCSMGARKLTGFEYRINLNSHQVERGLKSPRMGASTRPPTQSIMRVEYIETVGDQQPCHQLASGRRRASQPGKQCRSPNSKRKRWKQSMRSPRQSFTEGRRKQFFSSLSGLKAQEVGIQQTQPQHHRGVAAHRRQKDLNRLKELIELGDREQRILLDLYSAGVRERNQSKSLSPRSSPTDRLSWGTNEKKLKQYAATTLKRIAVSMKGIKARSYSSNRLANSQQKFQRTSQKRYVSPVQTKPATSNNFDEALKEEFEREEESVFIGKIIKIQRCFRRWRSRRRMLQLLHILYRKRPGKQETAVMTDPISLSLPALPIPHSLEGLEGLRLKEVKLMQEKSELLVQSREAMQLEMNFIMDSEVGIATNLHIINENLSCLVQHLVKNYPEHILEKLLLPYGSSAVERLRAMSGWDMEEYDPNVVEDELLQEFEQAALDAVEYTAPQYRCYQKFHNKVLFDAFNQALNRRQSYFAIQGQPFPWSIDPKAQRTLKGQDLHRVLTECKGNGSYDLDQVVEQAKILVGLHIEDGPQNLSHFGKAGMQNELCLPLHTDPFLAHALSAKVDLEVAPWLAERQAEMNWFENERTQVMIGLSECLMDVLLEEAAHTLYKIQIKRALQL